MSNLDHLLVTVKKLYKNQSARNKMIDDIVKVLASYSQIDGSHHKAWCLDQIAKAIFDSYYDEFVEIYSDDGDYDWDEGRAP